MAQEVITVTPEQLTAADIERIRADFPILERTVRDGKPLVYQIGRASCRERVYHPV